MNLQKLFQVPGKFWENEHADTFKVLESILCENFLGENLYFSLRFANVLFCQHYFRIQCSMFTEMLFCIVEFDTWKR